MPEISWKLHLSSPPEKVFEFLSTAAGRARFWAESAPEDNGFIHFNFINGLTYQGKILNCQPYSLFELEYFHSVAKFTLTDDSMGGTDLHLLNTGVPEAEYLEVYPGWLSVLFALKGAVDFNIDLRNHDPARTWDQRFVDN